MRLLGVTIAAVAVTLVIAASVGAARVFFRTFSMDVPKQWVWRAFPGTSGVGAEFSDWSLAGRHGFSPKADMPAGKFILWVSPLGEYGSVTKPTIRRSDFTRLNDPSRPRGQARADHSYCAHTGRCFEITLQYGGNIVPGSVLRQVNRALATVRAVPLPHP
jgi:hypothetical protein